jgi:hypothetical protein
MVTFDNTSFSVKVNCGADPIENWQLLHSVLLELMRNVNTENLPPDIWVVTDFISELMPEFETAKKML